MQQNMLSFSFKNVVFYIQVLGNLICVGNFGKVIFAISKHHNGKAGGGSSFWIKETGPPPP